MNTSGLSGQREPQENPGENLKPKRTRSRTSKMTPARYEKGQEMSGTFSKSCWAHVIVGRPRSLTSGNSKLSWTRQHPRSGLRKRVAEYRQVEKEVKSWENRGQGRVKVADSEQRCES